LLWLPLLLLPPLLQLLCVRLLPPPPPPLLRPCLSPLCRRCIGRSRRPLRGLAPAAVVPRVVIQPLRPVPSQRILRQPRGASARTTIDHLCVGATVQPRSICEINLLLCCSALHSSHYATASSRSGESCLPLVVTPEPFDRDLGGGCELERQSARRCCVGVCVSPMRWFLRACH
jgi:hypothetical protein